VVLVLAAILCPPIPTAVNCIPSTDNQLFGTVVEYNCLPGHYVNPNTATQYNYVAIECLETKSWNSTDIRDCARTLHTPVAVARAISGVCDFVCVCVCVCVCVSVSAL